MNWIIQDRFINYPRNFRGLLVAGLLAFLDVAGTAAGRAAGSPTTYRPLACGKAVLQTELAICRSYSLGQAEARMATLFGVVTSLVAMGQRADIEESQRQWLHARDACGKDTACLSRSYQSRIDDLSAIAASIAARGPF